MAYRFHSYEPRRGHGLRHDPLSAILGPRPIGWISTQDEQGRVNLAPYSFFNVFNYKPPLVAFSSVGWKDTVRNAQATGEFVYNLATRELAEGVDQSSASVGSGESEFALTGLAPVPSVQVAPPRVAKSPVSMECRVTQFQQLSCLDGTLLDTWMVMGEVVVVVHIAEEALSDGLYDTAALRPILRGGGPADYFEITPQARFVLHRPR